MPETPKKSTVYIDADDEITTIVDKVRSAPNQVVAMVLPKRASVLHSSVNVKLLKRVGEQNNKQLVLITSEPSLLPLAGMAGLYVASSLSSKPVIPDVRVPAEPEVPKEPIPVDDSTTVADVAPQAEEPIAIDNTPATPTSSKSDKAKAKKSAKKGKNKVPNFNKFRVLLFGGIAAFILLLVFGWWAIFISPSAAVTINGDTTKASANFDMIADTSATELDEEDGVIPAKNQEAKKTDTEKVPATGQKDLGTKASGSMTLLNCTDNAVTIPAGTGVSSGGQTYITQNGVRLDEGEFNSSGQCRSSGDHVSTTQVVAQNNGDQYNSGPRTYSLAGFSGVTGQGSQMSGGSSKIVKVVSAGDVESAKQKIAAKQGTAQDELKQSLQKDGYTPIGDTFSAGTPKVTTSPAVDSEASEVTVTSETTYTMLGVKEEDFKTLIKKSVAQDIDAEKQGILSYGIKTATYKVGTKRGTRTPITVQTEVIAGPKIDEEAVKRDIAGKKRGEAEQIIQGMSGVKEVRVDTKPFWNASVPKKQSKIKITVQKADGSELEP